MKNILIHLGYPKTATTFLQHKLFQNSTYFKMLNTENESIGDVSNQLNPFIELSHQLFNDNKISKKLYITLNDILEKPKENENVVSVISDESLSIHSDQQLISTTLKSLFPSAKVLLVCRSPLDFVVSQYLQHAKGFSSKLNYESFELWVDKQHADNIEGKSRGGEVFNSLRFGKTINLYINKFGPDNVLVLKFEDFKIKPHDFLQKIIDFSNVQLNAHDLDLSVTDIVNPRVSNFDLIRHRLNTFLPVNLANYFHKLIPKYLKDKIKYMYKKPVKVNVSPVYEDLILSMFKKQNEYYKDLLIRFNIDYKLL